MRANAHNQTNISTTQRANTNHQTTTPATAPSTYSRAAISLSQPAPQPTDAHRSAIKDTLKSLNEQLRGLQDASKITLPQLLAVCERFKDDEDLLRQAQIDPHARAELDQLRSLLPAFLQRLDRCLELHADTRLDLGSLQSLCMGLATLAPPFPGPLLTHAQCQDAQRVITAISTRLAAHLSAHFEHQVTDIGPLLNCLNWFSRASKAELLPPDQPAVTALFQAALTQMHAWSEGSSAASFNSRQLAKCMVQLNTMIRQRIDIDPATAAGRSNRVRWAECVGNLCRHFLSNHAWLQQCSEVELINVTNTLKDGLELNLLDLGDPDLARAFGSIVSNIGQQSFASPASLTALSNCANFLRCLFEHHRLGDPDGTAGQAMRHLLGKISQLDQYPDFHRSHAQALVNLASFLKAADRWLAGQSRSAATPYWVMLAQASASLVSALHTLGAADARWLAQPQNGSALLSALQHLAQRGLLREPQRERVQALVVQLLEAMPGWQIRPHQSASLLQSLRALMALVQRPVLPTALTSVPAFGPALAYLLDQLQQRLPAQVTQDERLACLQAVQVGTRLGGTSIDACQPLLQRLLKTTARVDQAQLEQALQQAGEPVEPVDALSAQVLVLPSIAGAATAETPAKTRGATYRAEASPPTVSSAPASSRSPVMADHDDWLTPRHAAKAGAVPPVSIAAPPVRLTSASVTMPTLVNRPTAKKNEHAAAAKQHEPHEHKPATATPATAPTNRQDKAGPTLAQAQQEWFALLEKGEAKALPRLQELATAYPALLTRKSAGKKGQPALFQALTQGRKEIVAWLLTQAPPHVHGDLGALLVEVMNQIAIVEKRHLAAIRLLLEAAVKQHDQQSNDVHARLLPDAPPLSKKALQQCRAVMLSDAETTALGKFIDLRPLLEEFKLIPAQMTSNATKNTAAKPRNERATLPLLFDQSVQTKYYSGLDITALMRASSFGQTDVVERMLRSAGDKDALVRTKSLQGITALMFAASAGHADTVATILRHVSHKDAVAQMQDGNGNTALTYAANAGSAETVAAILSAVNDKDTLAMKLDDEGSSALMKASSAGYTETAKAILEQCRDRDAIACLRDLRGGTALMHATYGGDIDVVKSILDGVNDADAYVNMKDINGVTALMHAALRGNSDIVQAMFDAADNNDSLASIQDRHGQTALMLAASQGHTETVRVILKNVKRKNRLISQSQANGGTAEKLAISGGYKETAAFIREFLRTGE